MAKGAPKGNQYAKGHKSKGGRKGYQYEKTELERMRNMLNKYLALGEKMMEGKIKKKDAERFRILSAMVLKIMDKLHANQLHTETDVNKGLPIHFIITDGTTNNSTKDNIIPPTVSGV